MGNALLDYLQNQKPVVRQGEGNYLRQMFPKIYGALGGLLGTAPDEFDGSVLDPLTAQVRKGAEMGYLPGLIAGGAPPIKGAAGLGALAGMMHKGSNSIDALQAAKAGKFVYPQGKALETAQRNAAMPVSKGGLGLADDNTPMDRARALGFKTAPSKTTYHATRDDVSGVIDPAKSDFGFHTGTLEQAEARVKSRSPTGTTYPEGANVMPLVMDKYANLLKVIDEGSFHADALAPQLAKKGMMDKSKAKDLVKKLEGNWMEKMEPKYDQQMRDIVSQNGYDGLRYSNAQEGIGTSYALSNPAVVRSRFAAFDPARRNESDILGKVDNQLLQILAGAGLLGVGGYNALKDN